VSLKTLGIDGCRAGWIAISLDDEGAGYWLLESDQELKENLENFDRIFIDVPIGLAEEDYVRECDDKLRDILGPNYQASVFNPPIRPALYAPTYAEASMTSYEITGKKISTQAWNITPNIKTVDQFLQDNEELQDKVFESHPELLFRILNGNNSILQKKATKKGLRHRLKLLKDRSEYADDFFRDIKEEYRRNQVDEDDIVDAMVLAWFALQSVNNEMKTVPEDPLADSTGLPMAIHYV
jgi:predicted RNase H-like nuclease